MGGEAFSRWLSTGLVRAAHRRVVDDANLSLTGFGLLQSISEVRQQLRGTVQPGDVVAAQLPSSVAYLVLMGALIDLGAVFVAVPADAEYLLQDVRQRCTPDWFLYPDHGVIDPGGRSLDTDDSGLLIANVPNATVAVVKSPARGQRPTARPSSGRVVVATSGSTGRAKLVSLHPDAYWYAAMSIREATGVGADDTVLHHLPIQRGAGWLLWGAIAGGAENVICPVRTAELPEVLRTLSITATFSVSMGLQELEAQDCSAETLPDLRTLYYSSGPVSVRLKASLVERFGGRLIQDYGMTEVPEPLAVLGRQDHLRGSADPTLLSSVGRPLHPGRVHTEGVSADAPAPVLVRSPHMFEGYWGEPAADLDRWHLTDDVGYLDEKGYLHLVGRRSESVRSGGVSFSLPRIRQALMAIEGVGDADLRVVPDDRLGERVEAIVRVDRESHLDSARIRQELRSTLTDPRMIPAHVVVQPTKPSIPPTDRNDHDDD